MSVASVHSDDERSVLSSISVSNQQVCCPYCSWSKKQRRLFKHIVDYHGDDLHKIIGTSDIVKTSLEREELLKIYISIYSPDDEFKEFDKTPKVIYGCLGDGCLNTYEDPNRAKAHWKKSKKCHQSHIKRVKAELKRVEDMEKKNKKTDWIDDLTENNLTFMIEKYRRFYYRLTVEDVPYLSSQPMNMGKELPAKYLNFVIKEANEFKNRLELVEAFKLYNNFLHKIRVYVSNNFTYPFDWNLPNPFDLTQPFEEAGLLPVGSSYEEYAQKRIAASSKYLQQQQQDRETISLLEQEKIQLLKELKKAQEAPKQEAVQESVKLEPIKEEPEVVLPPKVKRNSFTVPIPSAGSLVQSIQVASYPTVISNTKVKRAPKTIS